MLNLFSGFEIVKSYCWLVKQRDVLYIHHTLMITVKQTRDWGILFYLLLGALTNFRLNKLSPTLYILEESNFSFRYVSICDLYILREKWLNYLQQLKPWLDTTFWSGSLLLQVIVSDLGLHCLPVTLLEVSRLKWVNTNTDTQFSLCIYHSDQCLCALSKDQIRHIFTVWSQSSMGEFWISKGHGWKISSCWQWRLWSDCMHVQADQSLCWAQMSEYTFSNIVAQINIDPDKNL